MRILESFLFPTGLFRNQSKLVKSSRACHVISYILSLMLFNFQGTLSCRLSPADLYFSTPFRVCQVLFSIFFSRPISLNAASQAVLQALLMCSCLAVPLGSSLTSLSHLRRFVKHFFFLFESFSRSNQPVLFSMCRCHETALI